MFSYYRTTSFKWLMLAIDLLLFILVLRTWMYVAHVSLTRETEVFLVLSTLLAWSGLHGREMVFFDFRLFLLRALLRAMVFSIIYFVFIGKWYLIGFALLCYLTWLCISLLLKYWIYKSKSQMRFLVFDTSLLAHYQAMNYGQFDLLPDEFQKLDVQSYTGIIASLSEAYTLEQRQFLSHCKAVGVNVMSADEFEELHQHCVRAEALQDSLMENRFVLNRVYHHTKRILDVAVVIIFLPLIALVGLGVSALIFMFMGRPIFFTQTRYGLDGKSFQILKFRTMRVAKENAKQEETKYADQRVTKLGTFLRKWHLDEIPQFWNVLRGDMSIIGPRPEWDFTAQKFTQEIPIYYLRHTVRPGITGWAQVHQGHATGMDENYIKLRYDLFYVKYFSFWLDVKVVLKTIATIVTGFGAK